MRLNGDWDIEAPRPGSEGPLGVYERALLGSENACITILKFANRLSLWQDPSDAGRRRWRELCRSIGHNLSANDMVRAQFGMLAEAAKLFEGCIESSFEVPEEAKQSAARAALACIAVSECDETEKRLEAFCTMQRLISGPSAAFLCWCWAQDTFTETLRHGLDKVERRDWKLLAAVTTVHAMDLLFMRDPVSFRRDFVEETLEHAPLSPDAADDWLVIEKFAEKFHEAKMDPSVLAALFTDTAKALKKLQSRPSTIYLRSPLMIAYVAARAKAAFCLEEVDRAADRIIKPVLKHFAVLKGAGDFPALLLNAEADLAEGRIGYGTQASANLSIFLASAARFGFRSGLASELVDIGADVAAPYACDHAEDDLVVTWSGAYAVLWANCDEIDSPEWLDEAYETDSDYDEEDGETVEDAELSEISEDAKRATGRHGLPGDRRHRPLRLPERAGR